MKQSEQDSEILAALVNEDGITAYAISKWTGISVPQVNFRLEKLSNAGVVTVNKDNDKSIYFIHPALKSKDIIEKITDYLISIVGLIDEVKSINADGTKSIIEFIISRTDISDSFEEEVDDNTLISNFKRDIELYADERGLKINNIKGWTDKKIVWMATNERRCACEPDKRVCPCEEGLIEIEKDGTCKCSLFLKVS